MQLFITEFEKKGDFLIVSDLELLEQVRKVLRMKIGDKIFVQKENTRYHLEISSWDNISLSGKILKTILQVENSLDNKNLGMIVAMPNRWTKAELIVQKLSEIGINEIYFRASERSVLRDWNKKKGERLQKISKEAVEQSRGWNLPKIEFVKELSSIIQNKKIIVFDIEKQKTESSDNLQTDIIGIVGPEGGLTPKDYEIFGIIKDFVWLFREKIIY
ncbi:MAG: RsmE family RNA methyltransferase [Candidatus Absconditabacterales bacterium]|nr:RsmE family RNA methyltransferase [Candidatus Absconditabacterales bacterium]